MELLKNHRSALLAALDKAKEEARTANKMINSEDAIVSQYNEIADYIAREKIRIIEQALVDNEIDY